MADQRTTELTAIDAVVSGDLLPIIDDPAGTPVTKKATVNQVATYVQTAAGLNTTDSPQFAGINLGHASDTTLARSGAGVVTIEGAEITTNTGVQTLTNKTLTNPVLSAPSGIAQANVTGLTTSSSPEFAAVNIGHATDTTLTRVSAGVAAIEGSNILLASGLGSVTQAYDADLATIAGLTATTDNFIQSKSSAWASRTPAQVTADLIAMVGDSGSGGTKGLVPAPAAGDAAAGKYLDADGTWTVPAGGGGGGTPGGSDTYVQYNDGSAFGGDAGFTFNETNKAVTLGGATVTASAPVLDLSQTWNDSGVTFTGLKLNVTNTASAAASALLDLQVGGTSVFGIRRDGALRISGNTSCLLYRSSPNVILENFGVTAYLVNSGSWFLNTGTASLGWTDSLFSRPAAGAIQFGGTDAASPVAYTVSAQSVIAGTSNTSGVDWTLQGSRPTNTGTAGKIKLDTSFSSPAAAATTVTMTIATPCVVTHTAHGFVTGQKVVFTNSGGALPTGVTSGTTYYVVSTSSANTYNLATSVANAIAGTLIATTGSQSGTHTCTTTATVQNDALTSATWGPSGLTGSQTTPLLDLKQTWNTSGNVSGLKFNAVNVASGSSTLLLDLQVNGTGVATLTKGGLLRLANNGSITGDSNITSALIALGDSTGGNAVGLFGSVGIGRSVRLDSNLGLGWNVGASASGWSVGWFMESGVIAQRTTTTAQTYRLYRTWTDSSNYERLALQSGSGYFEIAAQTAGTGTDDLDLRLTTAGTGVVQYGTHSAVAAETVTGYITIKDAGGTTRKLAVIS